MGVSDPTEAAESAVSAELQFVRLVSWPYIGQSASAVAVLRLRPFLEPLAPQGPGHLRDLADAFLITALPEETLKLLAFVLGAGFSRELDEPMDGIVYGAAAALGFTAIENALFLFESGDPLLLLVRGFTATLGHVAFTATAAAWRISGASGPIIWIPTTRSVAPSTTSL